MNEHGDLPVDTVRGDGSRTEARHPVIKHRKVLAGRESRPVFWGDWDPEERKGEKVVCL